MRLEGKERKGKERKEEIKKSMDSNELKKWGWTYRKFCLLNHSLGSCGNNRGTPCGVGSVSVVVSWGVGGSGEDNARLD